MVIFNSKLLVIYTPMIFHVIIDVHHQGLSRWCGPGAVISGRDSFEPFRRRCLQQVSRERWDDWALWPFLGGSVWSWGYPRSHHLWHLRRLGDQATTTTSHKKAPFFSKKSEEFKHNAEKPSGKLTVRPWQIYRG